MRAVFLNRIPALAIILCSVIGANAQPAPTRGLLQTSFLGGSGTLIPARPGFNAGVNKDEVRGVAVDRSGNIFLCGVAFSADFPVVNAFQNTRKGTQDAFVMKLNADGKTILWSTYLGSSDLDECTAIGVDSSGQVAVTGWSMGADFPTKAAFQPTWRGKREAFITKFTSDGRLVNSSFLGGSGDDTPHAMLINQDVIYIVGTTNSPDFNVANNGAQKTYGGNNLTANSFLEPGDAFIARFPLDVSRLDGATYFGGSGDDTGRSITINSAGEVIITGATNSSDLPLNGTDVYQSFQKGDSFYGAGDGYIAAFGPEISQLHWTTYFGANQTDTVDSIVAGSDGLYLGGETRSEDFPVTKTINDARAGKIYFAKLSSNGKTLLWSYRLGGSSSDAFVTQMRMGADGNVYASGYTDSSAFQIANAVQPSKGGNSCLRPYYCANESCARSACTDGFIIGLAPNGDIRLSSFLGGNGDDNAVGFAFDQNNQLLVAGTATPNFPAPAGTAPSPTGGFYLTRVSSTGSPMDVRSSAVVNAADFQPSVASGALATIFGTGLTSGPGIQLASGDPLPTELQGTQVYVDGRLAPLVAIANASNQEQINLQIPFETSSGLVEVRRNGANVFATSVDFTLGVPAPACFKQDALLGSLQHGIGSNPVNYANPAKIGEVVVLYCTGLGTVSPPGVTGKGAPASPLSVVANARVSVGGQPAVVDFAGLTPGFVGLYQINFRVPTGVLTFTPQDVVVTVGSKSSLPVKIALTN